MKLKNKKVLVVGLGASGLAAVKFLQRQGAQVAVTDMRDVGAALRGRPVLGRHGDLPLQGLECHFGGHPPEIFAGRDLIVVSPGVPREGALQEAVKRGVPVIGEFELACRFLSVPLVAVTGTNGKSTVVTLIGEMLRAGGLRVDLAGNIGKPLLEVVMESKPLDWVVAEVSSYQLETTEKFHPRVAVLLNITEDHLDRYAGMKEYAETKCRIFERQTKDDLAIYNREDPWVVKGMRKVRARKVGFSSKQNLEKPYSLDHIKLVGRHNVENIMASVAVARFCGVSPTTVQQVLEKFEGLPHRVQFIREHQGVRYYDDSKGTNVDAVVRALQGFPEGSVVLIAGGKDKGGCYEPLREVVSRKVKHLILIGEAMPKIKAALGDLTSVSEAGDLKRAVEIAAGQVQPGDVVLLSPACSSFDQFRDYKERGDLFQKLVRQL